MSGGSLDYVYQKVEQAANDIRARASIPEHDALASHLNKVAKALHDLEWVWSSDYGKGDELEAIRAVVSPADILATATAKALIAKAQLEEALAAAKEFTVA